MAIITDYRITDDTDAEVSNLTVALNTDDVDYKFIVFEQDGIEVSVTLQMARDLIAVVEKLLV